jgi:hypothetical protein
MKVEFTKFNTETNWVEGDVNDGEYTFSAKLYDFGSESGIANGRVSVLNISIERGGEFKVCANFDREWKIRPKAGKESEVFNTVLEFLENSPRRFKGEDTSNGIERGE